uniref:Uncharacterized protein n=1 Tax=Rhizophora mucronata TaxID=61149 RepID=A0A2P2NF31_RHIMU
MGSKRGRVIYTRVAAKWAAVEQQKGPRKLLFCTNTL